LQRWQLSVLGLRRQPICRPPFNEKSAPVAKAESLLTSQAMIEAISYGSPSRLTGMALMSSELVFQKISMSPGEDDRP
jgi:hypothetical protein